MALFALGALAMRGMGCTWNDILDRKVDAGVERTRGRPLPSGELKLHQALIWMALQGAVGAAVLFKLNKFAGGVALCSLLLVAVYPAMKKVTSWPQVVLGLAFNWGALVGLCRRHGHALVGHGRAVLRWRRLDHGLRHDLRHAGPARRCDRRRAFDGAPLC